MATKTSEPSGCDLTTDEQHGAEPAAPRRDLRKTWAARSVATGFILAIACGNLWAANAMMNVPPPAWVKNGFSIGMIVAGLSGFWLGGVAIYWRFFAKEL